MKNPGRFSIWAGGTCIEVRMLRTCSARAGSSFGHNDGRFGSIFPAAVRNLDAPEKGVFLLRLNAFACERGGARCSADKVAARKRHDTARAIDVVERAKCWPGSGRA